MSAVETLFEGDPLQTSLCLIVILLACPALLMKVVPRIPVLRQVTFVPFLFLVPMVLSSLDLIPGSHPLYKPLQTITLYMAIFFMVLAIDVGRILRSLEPRVLVLFLLGCLGTAIGAVLSHLLFAPLITAEASAMVVACTAAAYTGGSMNWAAVSEAISVPDSLSATAFPAMVIMYTLYLGVLLALGNSPLRVVFERWITPTGRGNMTSAPVIDPESAGSGKAPTPEGYIHGFLAFCVVFLASLLLERLAGIIFFVPVVIFLTTFAIILGVLSPRMNFGGIQQLNRMSTLGEASLFFLLGIIGAQATLTGSLTGAPVLLVIPVVVIALHVLVLLISMRLLKVDFVTGVIVSIAAIGGAASAPVAAGALRCPELIPLGVLLSSLGYALGTYLGVYLGLFLLS